MSSKITNRKLRDNQKGMASILITMVMMIVVSLIVLGFAQISQREQRSALDRQLSTQAFYAAESGVNDALNAIGNGYLSADPSGKSSCTPYTSGPFLTSNSLNANNSVEYTCLLIQPTPNSLKNTAVNLNQPFIVPIQTVNSTGKAQSPNYVNIGWENNSGNVSNFNNCPTANAATSPATFPTTLAWTTSGCGAGVLRLDIVPAGALTGTSSRTNLQAKTLTVFFVPTYLAGTGATTSITYGSEANGSIVPVHCANLPYACNIQIQGITSNLFYWRLQAIYGDQTVCISADAMCGLSDLDFDNAQVMIDSTGKANDVLRRIQVQVALNPNNANDTPFVIQSTSSICKRFTTTGTGDNSPSKANGLSGLSLGSTDTSSCFGV